MPEPSEQSRLTDVDALVAAARERVDGDDATAQRPLPVTTWQPVHRFDVDAIGPELIRSTSVRTQRLVVTHAAALLGLSDGDESLLERVLSKLERQPIEDLRVEIGFDTDPLPVLEGLGAVLADDRAPGRAGIRVPAATDIEAAVRTLARFVVALAGAAEQPESLVVTLPGVRTEAQVDAFAQSLETLEKNLGLAPSQLRLELDLGATPAGLDGAAMALLRAAGPRLTGVYVDLDGLVVDLDVVPGTGDPITDHLLTPVRLAAAGTGTSLGTLGGSHLVPDGDAVPAAWAQHVESALRGLTRGCYQGRDTHPAILPARYVATFGFYRAGFESVAERLKGGLGDSFALAGFLLRGLDCGALDADEVVAASGLGRDELVALGRRMR